MKLLTKLGVDSKEGLTAFIKQVVKYGISGTISLLVSLGIYFTIIAFNENLYLAAYALCFIIGVLNSYFLNNRFVFKKTGKGHAKPLLKAYISYAATFLLEMALLFVMVEYLLLSKRIAPFINLAFTVPTNFLLNRFWTFK